MRCHQKLVKMQLSLRMRLVNLVHETSDALGVRATSQSSEEIGLEQLLERNGAGGVGIDSVEHLAGRNDARVVTTKRLNGAGAGRLFAFCHLSFEFRKDEISSDADGTNVFVQHFECKRDLWIVGRGSSVGEYTEDSKEL